MIVGGNLCQCGQGAGAPLCSNHHYCRWSILRSLSRATPHPPLHLSLARYLNFCTPLPRPLLEALARATLQTGSVGQIAKLYDQFLGFVSLEPNLFTLNIPRSFVLYNDPRMPDTKVRDGKAYAHWGEWGVGEWDGHPGSLQLPLLYVHMCGVCRAGGSTLYSCVAATWGGACASKACLLVPMDRVPRMAGLTEAASLALHDASFSWWWVSCPSPPPPTALITLC